MYTINNDIVIFESENFVLSVRVDRLPSLLYMDISNISVKDIIEAIDQLNGFSMDPIEFLLKKVSLYDSSSAVNGFKYQDKEFWFDKNTRASLLNLANCSDTNFTFVLGDEEVTVSASKAREFLEKLEKYAQKVYLNTQRHLRAINGIDKPKNEVEFRTYLDTIINYDFTSGYPEKIILE